MCKKAIESPSSAVVVCAHKEVLLECDLLYGHDDGHGLFGFDGDALQEWNQASGDHISGHTLCLLFGYWGLGHHVYLGKFRAIRMF